MAKRKSTKDGHAIFCMTKRKNTKDGHAIQWPREKVQKHAIQWPREKVLLYGHALAKRKSTKDGHAIQWPRKKYIVKVQKTDMQYNGQVKSTKDVHFQYNGHCIEKVQKTFVHFQSMAKRIACRTFVLFLLEKVQKYCMSINCKRKSTKDGHCIACPSFVPFFS